VAAPAPPGAYAIELPCSVQDAMRAADQAAEEWGATIERGGGGEIVDVPEQWGSGMGDAQERGGESNGGHSAGTAHLVLPVVAGMRRGLLQGPLRITAEGPLARVTFAPAAEDYHLETPAVAVLLLAGAGGLLAVGWPLFPRLLLPVAPLGAVLALSGWLLVLSRRRGKSPQDFFARLQAIAGSAAPQPAGEFPPSQSGI
jgi:hypothetical protein